VVKSLIESAKVITILLKDFRWAKFKIQKTYSGLSAVNNLKEAAKKL